MSNATRKQRDQKKSRGELLDEAFEVVRRFKCRAYNSREHAIKNLRRRCGGFSSRQYENAFDKALELYAVATEIIDQNIQQILKDERYKSEFKSLTGFDDRIRPRCPGFRISTCRFALAWIVFWHYLK